MLIFKYERKDFFGKCVYTEDKKENCTFQDIKKVFLYFSKDYFSTIQIDNKVIFWDCMTDFDNKIVTVRNVDNTGYTENKCSFEKAKTDIYKQFR